MIKIKIYKKYTMRIVKFLCCLNLRVAGFTLI